ncbi:MAG TPA: alpha/beta hydrolase [Planctomycetota bacterium]|nr:alpha/beta hydrolase [Planctomycetota bacterium]
MNVHASIPVLCLLAAVAPAQTSLPAAVAEHQVETRSDLQYSEQARDPKRNRLDLYLPKDKDKPPLVMFIHGGAWMGGNKDQHAGIGAAVAKQGFACAVINYSLAPIAKYPAYPEDCAAAFAWLYEHAASEGFDPDRMFLMGHSAGGHLAALLALDDHWLGDLKVPHTAIKGVIGLSGVYDVRAPNTLLDSAFGREPRTRAQASPILHASKAAPPFLLFWADHDMAGLPLSAMALRDRLQQLSVPVSGTELPHESHVSYLFHFGHDGCVISGPVFDFLRQRCHDLDAAPAKAVPAPAQGK